jgi:hypothetical protein
MSISTPSYYTLSSDAPFLKDPAVIARTQDLAVSWSTDTPARPTDEVAVQVFSGTTQVDCIFGPSAGTGVVPAAALGALGAGMGSYEVHSKQFASKTVTGSNGAPWKLLFNVDARARTPSGLASGPVTIQ